jgi:hypothetical protein
MDVTEKNDSKSKRMDLFNQGDRRLKDRKRMDEQLLRRD